MEILIHKLQDSAIVPARQTDGSAGADLYACLEDPLSVPAGETVCVPTGIALQIPAGYAGFVMARSGLAAKKGLAPANKVGLIDSDYRGEILVYLHNHSAVHQIVHPKERVAQLVIMPVVVPDYILTNHLTKTDRAGGFGSTGSY